MDEIKFGTDGWRAVIADQFTFENVNRIAQAVSDYLSDQTPKSTGIALGYDTRFLSRDFANTAARIIAANQIPVYLSNRYITTPMLSFAVRQRGLSLGLMITASHNPYSYNGIKFKGPYGGSASTEMTQTVASLIKSDSPQINTQNSRKNIHKLDFFSDYYDHIINYIDFDLIKQVKQSLVLNPMHGAGCGYLPEFLSESSMQLIVMHNTPDPYFGSQLPEPILKNLGEHQQVVSAGPNRIGIALDGDGDRFGVIDEQGQFVELHDLMPLLFSHLIDSRGWSGMAVRTSSMATTIDKVAQEYGRQCLETPVGFKHICQRMLDNDVLMGGEESGGFGYKNHIPERDGILSSLLLLEMLGQRQTRLSQLIQALRKKYGEFYYKRVDKYWSSDVLQQNMQQLRARPPEQIGDYPVQQVSSVDGIKFYFSDGSWMLMRISQTEPLGRIYVASDQPKKVSHLLKQGIKLLMT